MQTLLTPLLILLGIWAVIYGTISAQRGRKDSLLLIFAGSLTCISVIFSVTPYPSDLNTIQNILLSLIKRNISLVAAVVWMMYTIRVYLANRR